MATRWLIASGNVNDPTKWDGGVSVPGTGDTCVANGFTGTINVDFTCVEIRTLALGGGASGGGWTLSSGVTLTANVLAGTTNCLTVSAGNSTLIGNTTGSAASSNCSGTVKNSSGTFTLTGTCTGGNGGSTSHGLAITTGSASAIINVTGNVVGGSGVSSGNGIDTRTTAVITITYAGTIAGGAGAASITSSSGTPNFTINANLSSHATATVPALNYSTGTAVVTGNCTAFNSPAISLGSNATLTITGNVTAGTLSQGLTTGTGTVVTINGNVYGSSTSTTQCIQVTGTSLTVNGNVYAQQGHGLTSNATPIAVNGSIFGSTTTAGTYGVSLTSTGSLSGGSGTITGGSQTTSHGVNSTGTGAIAYTGEVAAGSSTGCGINLTSTAVVTVGGVTASSTANGILTTSTGAITINGTATAANGFSAVRATSTSGCRINMNGTMVSNATSGHQAVQTLGILLVGKDNVQVIKSASDNAGSIGGLRTLTTTSSHAPITHLGTESIYSGQ